MADSKQDIVLNWLRDAHAMEQQAEALFKGQADRTDAYPALQSGLNQYIQDTREHQRLLEQSIERLGGTPSTVKDMGGKLMAWAQNLSGLGVSDEVVKGTLACYVFQHLGMASYRVLIAGANHAGDEETARVGEQILAREQEIATWLGDQLPEVTGMYLDREVSRSA